MALRNIVKEGDEVLRKKCRAVDKIDDRILTILDDMAETLYDSGGVGLAAPQVGILRRIVVIDVGEGLIELVNPEIIDRQGSVGLYEGCLSFPGHNGYIERPEQVTVRAFDRDGNEFTATRTGMTARAICHECDHLDGVTIMELAEYFYEDQEPEEDAEEDAGE